MLNIIWLSMMALSIVYGIAAGNGETLSLGVTQGAAQAVELTIAMAGGMMLWCGILEVSQRSGMAQKLADVLSAALSPLFHGLKRTDAAMRAICMNFAGNVLGLGNAATPFGLHAMRELQQKNKQKKIASNDMITLVVVNCSLIQLIPTTLINIRIAAGSAQPLAVVVPSIIATAGTMVVGVLSCLIAHRRR